MAIRPKTHRDLDVWQKGIKLVVQVYKTTKSYPSEELYGLVSQMRRSAVSIASNVAEGAARNSKADFIRFLHVSRGSASELETQVFVSKELQYIDDQKSEELLSAIDDIQKMQSGLIRYLKKARGGR